LGRGRPHHHEPTLAALIIVIATITTWNRLNVTTRQVATWVPRERVMAQYLLSIYQPDGPPPGRRSSRSRGQVDECNTDRDPPVIHLKAKNRRALDPPPSAG